MTFRAAIMRCQHPHNLKDFQPKTSPAVLVISERLEAGKQVRFPINLRFKKVRFPIKMAAKKVRFPIAGIDYCAESVLYSM